VEAPPAEPSLIEGLPHRASLDLIWSILPDARLVGGVVRDLLAGARLADLDLATPEAPDAVVQRLRDHGLKVVPTGLAHGTVTAVIEGRPYEITTLRRDVETDGRHAVVAWTADWREDAARRDFTINAMSLDAQGTLHDYFGGREDLAGRRVRFVGEAVRRIEEDALRILRFFRFQARFGGDEPDGEAVAAIGGKVGLLGRLSAERIWSELKRILAVPDPLRVLALMQGLGVLRAVLPEAADLAPLAALVQAGAPADPLLRLAALSPEPAEALGTRLRLSRDETRRLHALLHEDEAPALGPDADTDAVRRALAAMPADGLIARSWLAEARTSPAPSGWADLRRRLAAEARPVFPLAGRDAVGAGLAPGPAVGQALEAVRGWWLAGGCRADRAACLARLRDEAAGSAP